MGDAQPGGGFAPTSRRAARRASPSPPAPRRSTRRRFRRRSRADTAPALVAGEGNAEEWLGAVPSSLAPSRDAAPPVQRLRLRYRKDGPARFIGSRELGSVFARAARRARLPIAYSRGHHPMPKLSFGPGLPVGASSDDELLDIELTASLAPAEVRSHLAAELPDGLTLLGVVEIPRAAPSIEQAIAGFRWEVGCDDLDGRPGPCHATQSRGSSRASRSPSASQASAASASSTRGRRS